MNNNYHIDCKNTYMLLAIDHIVSTLAHKQLINAKHMFKILAISESNTLDELNYIKSVDLSRYNLVLCSALFFHASAGLRKPLNVKFISLDIDYKHLQSEIAECMAYHAETPRVKSTKPGRLLYSEREIVFINDILSQMELTEMAEKYQCARKSIYTRKQNIMRKIGCRTNQQFIVALSFIRHVEKYAVPHPLSRV